MSSDIHPIDDKDFSDEFEDLFLKTNSMNDLGDVLTYYDPHTHAPSKFKAVFSESYKSLDMGVIVDVEGHNFQAFEDQIPHIKRHSKVMYQGEMYRVGDIMPDGSGWSTYILIEI